MGNKNGLVDAVLNKRTNQVIEMDNKNYFSFVYGDEIALVTNNKYYILNCDRKLWKKVKIKLKTTKNLKNIKNWWIKQSKKYEISDWSNDFDNL